MAAAAGARIGAESKINDVLARHPATAPVFTQGRRLYVDQPRELYARFPGLTVGDFARQNELDLPAVLVQVNALAESEDAAREPATRAHDAGLARPGQFSLTLGYTASHRPREDSAPDSVSVVAVQSSRGPE
ncbi:MAG TPA: hypothetical protein VMC04_13745 [Verrucomicrobiae bacterium]|jgi:hypothetical protein|nr:hypothetical protein [Verrucomicrobiae bacterium]